MKEDHAPARWGLLLVAMDSDDSVAAAIQADWLRKHAPDFWLRRIEGEPRATEIIDECQVIGRMSQ